MNDEYTITDEPLYYGTALAFVFLTTILTGLLGISWLLPALQTIALTIFMFPLLRQGRTKRALLLLAAWILFQFVLMLGLSIIAPSQMENTIIDGFSRRTSMLAWFYADDLPPTGLIESLGSRLIEVVAIIIGSALSAGLVGFWLLIRGINLAAFYAGAILSALSDTAWSLGAFPIWSVLRLSGYGLTTLIAGGLLTGSSESLNLYIKRRRTLLICAVVLTLLGLILEQLLPNLWRSWFS